MTSETTIPMLPCVSLDETLDFYRALDFAVTYRQTRPTGPGRSPRGPSSRWRWETRNTPGPCAPS